MARLAELRRLCRGLWLSSVSEQLLGNERDPMQQKLITHHLYNSLQPSGFGAAPIDSSGNSLKRLHALLLGERPLLFHHLAC